MGRSFSGDLGVRKTAFICDLLDENLEILLLDIEFFERGIGHALLILESNI